MEIGNKFSTHRGTMNLSHTDPLLNLGSVTLCQPYAVYSVTPGKSFDLTHFNHEEPTRQPHIWKVEGDLAQGLSQCFSNHRWV